MRRSGPCDFENPRTCTTCAGTQRASDTGGAEAMSAEWSSSMTVTRLPPGTLSSTFARRRARSSDIEAPVGFCARGCRMTAEGRCASAPGEGGGEHPVGVALEQHRHRPGGVDEVEEVGEAGRLDRDAIAEAHDLVERARDAVESAVDHGERLDPAHGPLFAQHVVQIGQYREVG